MRARNAMIASAIKAWRGELFRPDDLNDAMMEDMRRAMAAFLREWADHQCGMYGNSDVAFTMMTQCRKAADELDTPESSDG